MIKSINVVLISLWAGTCSMIAAEKTDFSKLDLTKLPPAANKAGLTYEKDVKPILASSCLRCHGDERPKGGLQLNSLEAALKGGRDGKVIIPGDSKKSLLLIA